MSNSWQPVTTNQSCLSRCSFRFFSWLPGAPTGGLRHFPTLRVRALGPDDGLEFGCWSNLGKKWGKIMGEHGQLLFSIMFPKKHEILVHLIWTDSIWGQDRTSIYQTKKNMVESFMKPAFLFTVTSQLIRLHTILGLHLPQQVAQPSPMACSPCRKAKYQSKSLAHKLYKQSSIKKNIQSSFNSLMPQPPFSPPKPPKPSAAKPRSALRCGHRPSPHPTRRAQCRRHWRSRWSKTCSNGPPWSWLWF